MPLVAFLAALLASRVGIADGSQAGTETFDEEALVRPLPDGKAVFVAHFRQSAPLASRHFETFPKAMAQIARATRVAEAELSFTQGRWDDSRWGRAPVGTKPIGVELRASFHVSDGDGDAARAKRGGERGDANDGPEETIDATNENDAPRESRARAAWTKLTRHLGGFFCASLGGLDEKAVVAPRLVFGRWNGGKDAVFSSRQTLHGTLPSEAVCVENLTPFLKLLPCRDRSGVGQFLKSRTRLFGAAYVSMVTRLETARVRGGSEGSSRGEDEKWRVVLSQTVTVVLDRDAGTDGTNVSSRDGADETRLSRLLGLDAKRSVVTSACVAARLSRVHAEFHAPFTVEFSGAQAAKKTAGEFREHAAFSPVGDDANALVRLRTWDLTKMDADADLASDAPGFDLSILTRDAAKLARPLLGYLPEFTAERHLVGFGNREGGVSVELRRHEVDRKRRDTRVRLFQALPWYVRVFVHTLEVAFDGEPVDPFGGGGGEDASGSRLGSVEAARWSPSRDRVKPSSLEMQVFVPKEVSSVTVRVRFEKAFLRVSEFPPDANRGFDLPPCVLAFPPPRVIRFFRNLPGADALESPLLDSMEGLAIGGEHAEVPERVYLDGSLLTLPTPDFSMPFNVITLVCTSMSLLSGGVLSALTRRPSWAGFKGAKEKQRKRLRELAEKSG
jgi:phosphatidylinositol glycan class T